MFLTQMIGRETRESGTVISTVEPHSMAWYGKFETGVSFDFGMSWIIVEGYETREEAEKGHEKYKVMTEEELEKLEEI